MRRRKWKEDSIYITGVGAKTPIGKTALRSAAAVRSGISAYKDHPFMVDRYGEPFVVTMVEELADTVALQERLLDLAKGALSDLFSSADRLKKRKQLAVIMAVADTMFPSPEVQKSFASSLANWLQTLDIQSRFHFVCEGHAAGAEAVRLAQTALLREVDSDVVVLGLDSYHDAAILERIDSDGRLHSVNNSWGFTPGEGAAAVLFTLGKHLSSEGPVPLAELSAIGVAKESKLLGTKTVCIGEGLTEAFRAVLSEQTKVSHSFCDLNGETYRADEFGFAVCRTGECFENAGEFTAAAQSWGDVGAATIPLQLTLATSAWSRRYAKGEHVLCWSSSAAKPLRGAIRLTNNWYREEE